MRILLCGYHEAGYRALRTLVARGHDVLVATHATPEEIPSVAALARSFGLPVVDGDPEQVFEGARRFTPEITFSVYYRTILPAKVLDLAPKGSFNFHPSLLPRHKGCFSAVWAILDGDETAGVTCHRMVARADAGEIVDVIALPVADNDTGMTLHYKLADAAVRLFERVLGIAECGPLTGRPQEGERSYHKRTVPYDGVINRDWPRECIERFIRALDFRPYPPACVVVDGARRPVRSLAEYDRWAGEGHQPNDRGQSRNIPGSEAPRGLKPAAR